MENDRNKKSGIFTKEELNAFSYIAELSEKQYLLAIKNAYSILRRDVKNKHEIEQGLDMLFEFLDDEDALYAYRNLCRHYWFIDKASTSEYIKMYSDEYDPDQKRFGNTSKSIKKFKPINNELSVDDDKEER